MKRLFLAALALLAVPAAPATAQSMTGCGTAAIVKADQKDTTRLTAKSDCFGKAATIAGAAETVHRARIAAIARKPVPSPTPAPTPAATWKTCAQEGQTCTFEGAARVRFGAGGKWAAKNAVGSLGCWTGTFGSDPAPGVAKHCETTALAVGTVVAVAPTSATKAVVAAGERAWPVPAKPTSMRGLIGVNIAGLPYYSGEQTFANLAMGQGWRNENGWSDIPRSDLTGNGIPRAELLSASYRPIITLVPPAGIRARDIPVRCTWMGKGKIAIGGDLHVGDRTSDHAVTFTWKKNSDGGRLTWVKLLSSDEADPVRGIDCQVVGEEPVGAFSRQVVDYYSNFGVLRMLDAGNVNANPKVTWSTRTQPGDLTQSGPDGMALEHQVALARAANADAWLNVSWNADEDYARRMAQLVHDGTPATRHVYVELSNEVWNFTFGVASQARDEGGALNLSGDGDAYKSAHLLYAKRTADLMRIWTEVFKDRPGQLIRVVSTMQDNPWVASVILGESGLGRSGLVDALASAPYFGSATSSANPNMTDVDAMFALLPADMDRVLKTIQPQNLAIAKQYGLRSISYEGGQHLVSENAAVVASPNRDPRMGDMYRRYLPLAIAGNDTDVVVLFNATGPISKYGAWGLREYAGQPIGEAPKMGAVMEAVGR